jgi:GT2 family glycosyltransferase
MRIDLVRLDPEPPAKAAAWPLGDSWQVQPTPAALAGFAPPAEASHLLFWSHELAPPDPQIVAEVARRPGEVHHAGLLLGQGGRPRMLDFVHPTWMLHRDPPSEITASSWRLSLRALLVPADRWNSGGPRAHYHTLDAASLELGWRWLWQGALLRHQPDLLPDGQRPGGDFLPLEDELSFLRDTAGRKWTYWALGRAGLSGQRRWIDLWRGWRNLREARPGSAGVPPAPDAAGTPALPARNSSVTVLIPTLDRYPYLLKLLEQLAEQTVPPLEILVVDQTARERRRHDLAELFPHLPLEILERDEAGQCSSRNAGLAAAGGEYVLFLDDDDEINPDLIARHLAAISCSGGEVSCGVADELGAGPLPAEFERRRLADVFPTNNSLIRRDLLERTGLFDLAYEKGARADADLGHRLYLSGALMVLEPEIRVLHHHAPAGGLRTHGARKSTFARSRNRLFARHLPEPTEIYLMLRYFSPRQVAESLRQRAAGTFAVRGGRLRQWIRRAWALLMLPDTLLRIASRKRRALALLGEYPRVPSLRGDDP